MKSVIDHILLLIYGSEDTINTMKKSCFIALVFAALHRALVLSLFSS